MGEYQTAVGDHGTGDCWVCTKCSVARLPLTDPATRP